MQHGDGMRPFLVVHATRSGHTRRIAEHIADRIRTLAHEVQLQDVRTEALPPLTRYSAVILASGVHLGHHDREMVRFVRARRQELTEVPTLFLSVSLTEAAAEDLHRPDDERLEARRATIKVLDDFVLEAGWQPWRAVPVAGAMDDSGSGSFGRMLMRTLLPRDLAEEATRGVVFTDWIALNGVVDGLVREARERSKTLPPSIEPPAFRSAVEGAVLAP
jgi:menaquinone-dependent protoporphyrinogen oxidase